MLTTGVDMVEVWRIRELREKFGDRFINRIYTENEQRTSRMRDPELAARFASKEAVMKLLGTGVRGVGWKDIEILPRKGGKPEVHLHGRALNVANRIGLTDIAISQTHSIEYAISVAVGDADQP
ncbi:MAG: holo-ACP synthase [Dehalococcoidia bacterium]|tara:strand:- start:140 stop:511 length:372 start_codon:yes stop_codon:yes gene_type:complete